MLDHQSNEFVQTEMGTGKKKELNLVVIFVILVVDFIGELNEKSIISKIKLFLSTLNK